MSDPWVLCACPGARAGGPARGSRFHGRRGALGDPGRGRGPDRHTPLSRGEAVRGAGLGAAPPDDKRGGDGQRWGGDEGQIMLLSIVYGLLTLALVLVIAS